MKELREFLGIIEWVVYSLVTPGKGRQCFGPRAFLREDGNEAIIWLALRSRKGETDLAFNPVHDAVSADMDAKGRSLLADHFLQLGLPANARYQVILIQPYAKASSAAVGTVQKTAF